MSEKKKKIARPKFDKKWMNKLLEVPEIADVVKDMSAKELEFYKDLLVRSGVYGRWVIDQQKQIIRSSIRENFPGLLKG